MNLMNWLHEKFGLHHHHPEDNAFRQAIAATSELTTMTKSLREQLEPYRREIDPFASIMRKHEMARDYDEGQIRNIHRGPEQ